MTGLCSRLSMHTTCMKDAYPESHVARARGSSVYSNWYDEPNANIQHEESHEHEPVADAEHEQRVRHVREHEVVGSLDLRRPGRSHLVHRRIEEESHLVHRRVEEDATDELTEGDLQDDHEQQPSRPVREFVDHHDGESKMMMVIVVVVVREFVDHQRTRLEVAGQLEDGRLLQLMRPGVSRARARCWRF